MKIKHMKIIYTMVWPVLIDIKWAPTTKINLHKHLNHRFFITKISRFTVCVCGRDISLLLMLCKCLWYTPVSDHTPCTVYSIHV